MTQPRDTAPPMSLTLPATSADGTQPVVDSATPSLLHDIDPQIIEALRGEHRSYVLKLGDLMESLINNGMRQGMALLTNTDNQRSLIHRCCAYYQLKLEVNPLTKIIYVVSTSESRIISPMLKLSELIPAETNVHPHPLSIPQPQSPIGVQTPLPPPASSLPDLQSHVESDSGRMISLWNIKDLPNPKTLLGFGSLELDETHAHCGHKTSSKALETITISDFKRPVAGIQDDSGSQDGQAFFRGQLKEFKRLYQLEETWPPDDLVLLLSSIAKGFTDLASLAVRYLRDPFIGDPQFQLGRMINILKEAFDHNVRELPRLYDSLCLDILSRIPLDTYDRVKLILISQVLSTESPHDKSLAVTCDALDITQSKAYEVLRYLHPVISIPSPRDITHKNITIYDDSFLPFLIDSTRSGDYAIMKGEDNEDSKMSN